MPLIKMATAARRARLGSTKAIRRALTTAGVPMVTLSPGEFAVEEADLNRFLTSQQAQPAEAPRPKPRPAPGPAEDAAAKPKKAKRRS